MMTKPIHRIFLKRVVLTLLLAVMTAAAWADDPWVSGDCTVTLTDGTLTVSGNGAMADYGPTIGVPMSPWYYNANSITNIVIGSGVTHIGRSAFQDCDNLVTVTFEANSQLTTIGHNAFSDCEALPAIDIPNSVTTIGDAVFFHCIVLQSVNFGSGLTSIGDEVFLDCWALTTITVDANNANFKGVDGVLFSEGGKKLRIYPEGKTATAYTVPDDVTSIGDKAFKHQKHLTSVTIPASVTTIDNNAFYSSDHLETVTFEANSRLTTIGEYAFHLCDALPAIDIPNSVTTIGDRAFFRCSKLTSVTISASVTSIGAYAFKSCNGISSLTFEANSHLTTIGEHAFGDCYNLTSVTIPASVTCISDSAFYNCASMTSLTFEAHTQLTAIGEGVFMRCTGLTSVAIPDGVTTIGKYAFMSTSNLASVTIPASVTCISDSAFYNCYNLATITVDENSQLTTIGMNAFYISKWLRTHPDGLAYIGNVAYQLKGSTFDGSIREGTVGIADGCFASKTSITAVTIPNTVKIIGTRAFSGCTSLTSIVIPNSVTCIGDSAFYGCTGMTSAHIGRGVTTIGAYAFNKCHQLASIIIGSGVTTIGKYAFAICLTQRTLTIYATIPPKTEYCFYNNHTRPTLYVFSDCLDDYTDFYKWDPLTYTYAIPDLTANDAGGELGRWCTYYNGLADVTMPAGTTVYKAAVNGAKNGVVLTPTGSRIVKAGEAVLLNTTAEGITIASAANGGTGDYEGNELRGVDIETPQTDGTTYYVLSKVGDQFGFFKLAEGTNLAANKAYLLIPASAGARSFLGFGGDDSTGIDTPPLTPPLAGAGSGCAQEEGEWFSLDGRRLSGVPTQKGVYVRDGKKFIIK